MRRKIIFDTRWLGTHGIGRFAAEVYKSKLDFMPVDLTSKPADALDPYHLTKYLITRKNSNKKTVFYSPGYNFPLINLDRTVITIHDLNHIDVEHNSSLMKKIYYEFLLKKIVKKVPLIITVSEFTRNRIASWAKISNDKIYNVGNGVSQAFNKDVVPYESEKPYYLIVGNRKKHKNEMLSLNAFKAIGDSEYNLLLTGSHSKEIDDFVEKNNLKNNVFYVKADKDSDLASLYKGAHCLLFPSHYEGFGLPVIEAMACGTPVITSNTSSLPEVSGDAALLVNPNSLDEMILAMNTLKTDDNLRNELIKKGYLVAQKYDWNVVRHKVEDALSKI